MPAPLEAWEKLLKPTGPAHVRHSDGSAVTYATRIRARGVGDVQQVLKPEEIELELHDEVGNVIRIIDGVSVENIEADEGQPIVVVVADSVEPDPGPSVKTRG